VSDRLTIPDRAWVDVGNYQVLHRAGHYTVVRRDQELLLLGDPWLWQVRPSVRTTFFEEDEPVEDVVAAFERGTPGVTGRPLHRVHAALVRLPEGTLLRARDSNVTALAWRVTTTDHWAVTGHDKLLSSLELLMFASTWEPTGVFGVA
jgi:hypothetical protein